MDRIDCLRAFVRSLEGGSFSVAANELGIGQPAVSKRIALLESEFGTQLFFRTTRKLKPTPEGQRIYDLAERVLPPDLDTSEPSADEMARFMVRRALNGRGFASSDSARWGRSSSQSVPEAIEDMKNSGEITELEISGLGDETYYALTKNIEEASRRSRKRLHILSPFDNLVIDRGRLKSLFDFGYKLECYLPADRRKYGYFSLAVLWGKEFVGRLDPKADRKKKTFIVRNMIFEPDFSDYESIMPVLARKLWDFASFNECESIVVEKTDPAGIKAAFIRELDSAGESGR